MLEYLFCIFNYLIFVFIVFMYGLCIFYSLFLLSYFVAKMIPYRIIKYFRNIMLKK